MNRQECFESGGHDSSSDNVSVESGKNVITYHCTKCEAAVFELPIDDDMDTFLNLKEALAEKDGLVFRVDEDGNVEFLEE